MTLFIAFAVLAHMQAAPIWYGVAVVVWLLHLAFYERKK